MKAKLSMLLMFAVMGIAVSGNSLAQEAKLVPEAMKAPTLHKTYSKEKPTTGVLAASEFVVAVTTRGAFALSASQPHHHGVFEYVGRGFDEELTFIGHQSGFIYFKMSGYQIILAIRETGPNDVWFFVNGGTSPVLFADSARIYAGN